ncbi:MAG: helix-turn-helix transcriptional regulator [Chloroflexi bacterium]|nr:helix-turn-helix transcriptional regulator [Chloroflexota bacterium]
MPSRRKTDEQLLGNVIRSRREEIGISQEDLALECDLHRTYISQLERGQKSPTLRVIFVIAKALKMTPARLVELATPSEHS